MGALKGFSASEIFRDADKGGSDLEMITSKTKEK